MRRWWRRDRHIPIDLTQGREASAARKRAEAQWGEIREVLAEHKRVRRENHFAERMQHAFEEHA